MTMVSVDLPPAGITPGENCLTMLGGVDTISAALLGSALLTPSTVVTPPAGMVLV